eukprot:TRINITY_DN10873_c0_g1_i8.p1 TRINITY_DN10873_c0_g1~~TRINITY_DN10873_c0_g1_i8.p1  ORF type:complete len:310 (+),score=54.91 TRINITY_DN10873_c0_g1_i8:152-1081(+)
MYSAVITLQGGTAVPYFLDEDNAWQIKISDLESSISEYKQKGIKPKLLVVINPGNPTGQIFSDKTIQEFIKFAHKHNLTIIADEVYQQNIFKKGAEFHSFRKVVTHMPEPYNKVQILSLNSISKGYTGDCGFRGGYVEAVNVDKKVWEELTKIKDVFNLPTIGGIALDLAVNPPKKGREADETVEQFEKEKQDILSSLKRRAEMCTDYLNKMDNLKSNPVDGAMYAFPQIFFGKGALKEAERRQVHPELMYCMEALEKTGVVTVPGNGFGERPDTYHFRTTTLVLPEPLLHEAFKRFHDFNKWFHQEYK